jgi:ATP-dependent Clp protease protease subunit
MEDRIMDNNFDELIVAQPISDELAHLRLPDPSLVNYYKDVSRRVYHLEGEIDDSTLEFVNEIFRINADDVGKPVEDRLPIMLFINSIGGDVQVMWNIINAMKISKTPVYTVVYSVAMSAAAHILAAGKKRYAMPGSTILIHSGSCQFNGDVEKVESAKKYYDALSKQANKMLLASTKIQPKDLKKKGAIDWYMTAEEAREYGIVDSVVSDIEEVL